MQARRWVVGLAAAAMVTGCSASSEDTTSAVADALEQTSSSGDSTETAGALRGGGLERALGKGFGLGGKDAIEGFHCDAEPDVTPITVCGRELPAAIHLEWTDCAAAHHGGKKGGGAEAMGAKGDKGKAGDAGLPAGDSERPARPEGEDGMGPSSGTVDITAAYSTPEGCEGAIVVTQVVTFEVQRANADGEVFTVAGTASSLASLGASGPPQRKQASLDVTRSVADSAGAVLRSVHLTGQSEVAFSSDTPPTRTVNESLQAEYSDGTVGRVTRTDVVIPPRDVCEWPLSGTLVRTKPDGTTSTLVYGPDCGAATLDGEVIELQKRGKKH